MSIEKDLFVEILSKRLKELRKENTLTQNDVAKILKISRVVYNRYENGQREIPLDVLCEIADYYKVSVDYILGRVD